MDKLRSLPPLNTNYTPPRPWQCNTYAEHDCDGQVIGALDIVAVCAAGEVAERAERVAHRARIQSWAASPEGRRTIAAESAIERSMELGY